MKKLSMGILITIVFILLAINMQAPPVLSSSQPVNQPVPLQPINYSLVTYFLDYLSKSPVFNLSFTLQTNVDDVHFSGVTNASGLYQYYWTSDLDVTDTLVIQETTVKNNFTILNICDIPIENTQYSSLYDADGTHYWDLNLRPRITREGNITLFHCPIWVNKGKLVTLADRDPVTQTKRELNLGPAVPASITYGSYSPYETHYFFPLNYSVNIRTSDPTRLATSYPPISVRVDENATFVSWTGLAAQIYSKNLLNQLKGRMDYFAAFGLSMIDETRQHVQVSSLFELAIFFFQNRSYPVAFSTMEKGIERAHSLDDQLSQLAMACIAMPILIILFSYGFASLLPTILTENEKTRATLKLLMFFSIFFVFLLTQPHTQIGAAMLFSSLFGTTISSMDLLSIVLSCFVLGTISFVAFLLISLKARVFMGFALDLGIRDLRRRMSRTLLTLFTITIVIGASVTFTEVTSGWSIVETGRREGIEKDGLIMFSRLNKVIQPDETLWIQGQLWCKDVGRQKRIVDYSFLPNQAYDILSTISRLGKFVSAVKVIAIDPEFMSKYYDLPAHIQGSYLRKKEAAVMVSTSLTGIQVGDMVSLDIVLVTYREGMPIYSDPIPVASFLVKGKFDPVVLSRIKRVDGEPLFPDSDRLILVSYDLLPDFLGKLPITEITSLTIEVRKGEGLAELAKNLVFSLGYKVTANRNGVALSFEELYILSVVGWTSVIMPTIITGLIVYLTMSSVIFERKRQISIFATLGAAPKKILQIFLMEALILGFLSTFLGYFGSYLSVPLLSLILIPLSSAILSFFSKLGVPTPVISFAPPQSFLHYSLSSVLIALAMGIMISLLGGLIPCARAQEVSLTGRPRKRDVARDLREVGNLCEYPLPVRVPSLDGEMLYIYLRDQVKKVVPGGKSAMGDGDLSQDGTFSLKFDIMLENYIESCQLSGVKRGEAIYPSVTFPKGSKDSYTLQKLLYNLEKATLGYTSWRETRMRFEIIRMAPKLEVRRLDDVLFDVKQVREQQREVDEKLEKLESLKLSVSGAVYSEFEKKYLEERQSLNKRLRPLGLELEPFYNETVQQARELNIQMERIITAHELGELDEERYEVEAKPMKEKLSELQKKLDEMDYVFTQLKMPHPTIPREGVTRERERRRRVRPVEAPASGMEWLYCPYCGHYGREVASDGVTLICSRCRRKLYSVGQ